MQSDPTKIQECHLCLLIQDRATLPFLLATKQAKHTLPPPLEGADGGMTMAPLFCLQGGNLKAVSRSPALSAQDQPSTQTPVQFNLRILQTQPAQTCHSKRDSDCICTCYWFKHRLCLILKKKKLYYYIIAKRIQPLTCSLPTLSNINLFSGQEGKPDGIFFFPLGLRELTHNSFGLCFMPTKMERGLW